jgi:sarcosine oxidase, subunit gamma
MIPTATARGFEVESSSMLKSSPVASQLSKLKSEMRPIAGTVTAAAIADGAPAVQTIGIVDLSCLPRFGVKGPRAAAALEALGLALPPEPNRWAELESGGIVARLGRSEFLLEDGIVGGSVRRVHEALADGASGVYPVPRQDLALALVGSQVPALWEQTCSFDLRELDATPGLVVMTTMIGVSITVVRADCGSRTGVRLWCDGTFGPYFFETLLEIAEALQGGAAGICDLFPEARRLAVA